jgi:hypothetical protein
MDERPCFVCAAMDLALPSGVRVPIASLTPVFDAKLPVSFARNTALGRLLSMAGSFEAVAMIAVSEGSLSLG